MYFFPQLSTSYMFSFTAELFSFFHTHMINGYQINGYHIFILFFRNSYLSRPRHKFSCSDFTNCCINTEFAAHVVLNLSDKMQDCYERIHINR